MEPRSDGNQPAEAIAAEAERLRIAGGLRHGSVDAMKDFFEMSGVTATSVVSRTHLARPGA